MLKLTDIVKTYQTGDSTVTALRGISLQFRQHEFVSVLGQSGCGKTTLLNIIGGLDQYTSGDLEIAGRSTKGFRSSDWDAYRNHSIGFVFQSYQLIPHLTVLANVELALTLSGVGKAERRRRAIEALTRVGLGDQLRKKPAQMSGGQMQRVAIARALVNDPEILLADEPTGALDTQTSVQIMEILKEISADKLIIMVTHNPDLAEQYSNRIIRLLDGQVISDSMPYDGADEPPVEQKGKRKAKKQKTSMSFFTALSLSFRNLLTKKTRTLLTAFAGSIGIIGIALILSLSTGVQNYINQVQEDTLASYPLTLQAETIDMTDLMVSLMADHTADSEEGHPLDAVYTNSVLYEMMNTVNGTTVTTNNLAAFRDFLNREADESTATTDLAKHLSAVQYSYALNFDAFTKDPDGKIIRSDVQSLIGGMMSSSSAKRDGEGNGQNSAYSSFGGMKIWQEMLPGENGALVSDLLTDKENGQYELLAGDWPKEANEVVLILDKNNELSDLVLYALGLKSSEDMKELLMAAQKGEQIDTKSLESWSYDDILKMHFRLVLPYERFVKNSDGTYTDVSESDTGLSYLYENGREMTVCGILRPNEDASSAMLTGAIGYTTALTQSLMDELQEAEIIRAQMDNPKVDVRSGLPFADENAPEPSDAEKAEAVRTYFASLTDAEKALLYTQIMSVPTEEQVNAQVSQMIASLSRAELEQMIVENYATEMGVDDTAAIADYIAQMDDETLFATVGEEMGKRFAEQYAAQVAAQLASVPTNQLAMALESTPYTDAEYANIYDSFLPSQVSESTYEAVLNEIGYTDPDAPTVINLYASTFAAKDAIKDVIASYNADATEENQISYTDYVALLMSSVTTIINAISYVLIAFVSISLVVSSIMIGIITYISVLERTREIGILRAIGASKRDISRVFNAETVIVGFFSGMIGIGSTLLLCIPINAIVRALTDISNIRAVLPWQGGTVLVIISILLTLIAGLIPAGLAAKKDPVIALRSE